MKKPALLTMVLLAAICSVVRAQADLPTGSVDAERSRIASERVRLETGYKAEDAACYQRFAVNYCLDEVNARRRETMGDLRRQEILLNEQDRQRKGAEQIRRTDAKAGLESQQAQTDQRNRAALDARAQREKDQNNQALRPNAGSAEQANSDSRAARMRSNQQKKQARAARQSAEADATKQFNDRQQAAQVKREEMERDRAKAGKPPAKPLPPRP
jgi:colicin import membrane protein